jgi:trinucleotide repeat-containing gene 6 protein
LIYLAGNQKNDFVFNNEPKEEPENWSNNGACMNAPNPGWEEQRMATAAQTSSSGSVDDGTALWGTPQGQNKVLLWKDEHDRTSRNSNEPLASSPGVLRIPSNVQKESWKQPGKPFVAPGKFNQNFGPVKKGNWNDQEAEKPSFSAPNTGPMQSGSNWSENATLYWNKQKRNYAAGQAGNSGQFASNGNQGWNDGQFVNTGDWGSLKSKPLSREMILASNQYKMLVDQGFKKDEVENALRQCNMNIDETIDELRSNVMRDMDLDLDKRNKVLWRDILCLRCVKLISIFCFSHRLPVILVYLKEI